MSGLKVSRGRLVAMLPVVAFLLSGCATLVGAGGPVADIFDLSAPTDFEGMTARTGAQLLVPPPSAVAALASNRIAVRPDPARIAYYSGAVWSDELPNLLQLEIVRAFVNSNRAKSVGRPGDSLAIDYQVLVDVRAFEIDIFGGETAHVVFGVKLLDDTTGRVRASRLIEARVPVAVDTAEGAVAALERAAGEAMTELVAWTASTL
ncbi:MAG TPA: ABC-type transport auxiliary lipoprotein family protein [Methylomirabilota bacterium]|nr:ABC-type transport auxiliary lipoprotein family protein [Methylomirabilota bacterium]